MDTPIALKFQFCAFENERTNTEISSGLSPDPGARR